jgi:formate hydrogenlyase transcriptional activator
MRTQIINDGPKIFNETDFEKLCTEIPLKRIIAKKFQVLSNFILPLKMAKDSVFIFSFYSRRPDAYSNEHLHLLQRLQPSLELTIDRLIAFDEIKKLSEQLNREKTYLQEEVKTTANFEEIIGTSHSLLHVFDSATQVASLNTSVLLLGESGTGKELVAVQFIIYRHGKISY